MTSFGRVWRVTVGTLRVSAPIRVAFHIERTLHARPGKAVVKIWNLTRSQQAQIEQSVGQQLVVEAGYSEARGLEQLFRGHVFRGAGGGTGFSQRANRTDVENRVDAASVIEGRDGGEHFQQRRVNSSFAAGVSVTAVVRSCAEGLGVGIGNTAEAIAAAVAGGADATFPEGTVLSGPAARELTRVLSSFGLSWSIQHGALQVLASGAALRSEAVRLATDTGLVGEPERGMRGRAKVKSLLTPDIWPGRTVVLDHDRLSGPFLVRSVVFDGDSHQQNWYADAELRAA